MATVNFTGFETGDSAEAQAVSGTISIQSSVTRHGGYALRTNPTGSGTGRFTLGRPQASGTQVITAGSLTTGYVTFSFYYTAVQTGREVFFWFIQAAGQTFELILNTDGTIQVQDADGNDLGVSATALSAATWYTIQAKVDTGTTDWELKIDGVTELSGTGANLGSKVDGLRFGKNTNNSSSSVNFFFDDIVWNDSAYPDVGSQIAILKPNAAGNYQTATRGGADSGNNWDQVDEVPHNSDTNYLITDSTSGYAETEGLEASSVLGISGTINCVKSVAVLKRDGASNGAVTLRTRSGSTDTDTGSDYASTSAYALIAKIFDVDPADSGAWSTSDLDGLEVGMVEKSATNKTRMTMCAAMVDWTPSGAPAAAGMTHSRQRCGRVNTLTRM